MLYSKNILDKIRKILCSIRGIMGSGKTILALASIKLFIKSLNGIAIDTQTAIIYTNIAV